MCGYCVSISFLNLDKYLPVMDLENISLEKKKKKKYYLDFAIFIPRKISNLFFVKIFLSEYSRIIDRL